MTDCRYELRLYELGASGEVADIQVRCAKCEKKRRMSDAFSEEGKAELSQCRGRLPHLRKFDEQVCAAKQRAILLGASNSWFPMTLSALSIPSTPDKLGQLIELNWTELEECESAREVKLKRKLLRGLATYTHEEIWAAVEKKGAADQKEEEIVDLREPEWKIFSDPDPNLNSRDFRLRVVDPPKQYRKFFTKVVLAERLREVSSLIGFTRIESPSDYTEVGEFPKEQRVPLSRKDPRWVPTSEVRGEGVFIQFSEKAIQSWVKRVKALDGEFFEAHRRWRTTRGLKPDEGYPTRRIAVVSYAVYNIPHICDALIRAARRGVAINVIVETPDRLEGKNTYDTLAAFGPAVAERCSVYLWPLENRQTDESGKAGILHVKCAVADGRWLFLSSANLTEYAFTINMELGLLVTGGNLSSQVENHFDRMIHAGVLAKP